jgi:hypothetical protein
MTIVSVKAEPQDSDEDESFWVDEFYEPKPNAVRD